MLGIDRLNDLLSNTYTMLTDFEGGESKTLPPEEVAREEDIIEELLIMAYIFGDDDGRSDIGVPKGEIDIFSMGSAINKPVAGKTWRDRLKDAKTRGEIQRIKDTESYRVYNNAVLDAGLLNGGKDANGNPIMKTWETVHDEKVRDTHAYLNGMTIPIGEEFYTYNGNHAPYPHGFNVPDEDVNCRCIIKLNGQGRP